MASKEFHATSYWGSYDARIVDTVGSLDTHQLRSGKYPILATFGYNDVVYIHHPNVPVWKELAIKFLHKYLIKDRTILPYHLNISAIREMAYRHCEILGELSKAKPINTIEVSTFGNPQDIFEMSGRQYTTSFLSYYLRYCFSHNIIAFKGDETIVELGSGSGYQVEVLKKLYPEMTILCFDLPAQVYLCETYLSAALGEEQIVGTNVTLNWKDLSKMKKGCVHFLGNWQIPLLKDFQFEVFWNAASFGEMEPDIVENYLSYIKGNAKWVYLLQARLGRKTSGKNRVVVPITHDDYDKLLSGYRLVEEQDAWKSYGRLSESGGYFQGIWLEESE